MEPEISRSYSLRAMNVTHSPDLFYAFVQLNLLQKKVDYWLTSVRQYLGRKNRSGRCWRILPRRRAPKYGEIGEPQTADNCCQELSPCHVSWRFWEDIRHRMESLNDQESNQADRGAVKRTAGRHSEED